MTVLRCGCVSTWMKPPESGDGRRARRAYLARVDLLTTKGVLVGTHDGGMLCVVYLAVEVPVLVGLSWPRN